MSLPGTAAERICRLALLDPRRIDIAYGTTGARVISFLVEPDENWSKNDGLALIQTQEAMAGVDFNDLRAGMLKLPEGP